MFGEFRRLKRDVELLNEILRASEKDIAHDIRTVHALAKAIEKEAVDMRYHVEAMMREGGMDGVG